MNSDFKDLLADLCRNEVRFLVVGGYAVMFHTEPRFTKDLDLWIEPTRDNAERFRSALLEFGAWMNHMQVADFCQEQVMFQIGLPPSRIDFLTSVPGLEFGPSWHRRDEATIGSLSVPMLGLPDIMTAKETAGRDQDLLDLAKLKKVRPLGEEQE